MESKEKSEVITEKSDDSFSGFGEVEENESGQKMEENGEESLKEDNHNKKEPITILSVEVMSSRTELQSDGEPNEVKHVEKDMDATTIKVAAVSSIAETKSNSNPGDLCVENIDIVIENAPIPNVDHVLDNKNREETENISNEENTSEPTNVPLLGVEAIQSTSESKSGHTEADDAVVDEYDTLPDAADIPNDSSPVAESSTILKESMTSTEDNILSENSNDNVNVSLPVQTENLEESSIAPSTTGLSLLAQYGSDNGSDTESVIEVPLTSNQDYRNKVVEIDSDSDSDSSSDSEVEYLNVLRKKIEKRMEVDDDDEDEEDETESIKSGNKRKPKPKVKAKGELLIDDLPPIQDLQITVPEEECVELGKIHSIVDQLVLVSALPNSVLLDLETVLFLDKGQKVLGEVFDVLGQVADPLYCVRFNSHNQINEKDIKVNDVVFVAPKTKYTQFIILSSLMNIRGSDASWENDIEPPPRFLDYSDDEQEQLARRQLRNRNRPMDNDDPEKRMRTDSEGPQISSSARSPATQYRNRHPFPRGAEASNHQSSYGRPRPPHNPQYRNQQSPNNNPSSSWHSNYYPQQAYPVPPPNYGFGGYPPMPVQNYPQVPMYPMPPMHSMPYPPPQHLRPPLNNAPPQHQMVPGVFSIRPPTMGHYESSPPPPGGH